MPLKPAASLSQRQPVPVLILQAFSRAHLTISKLPVKALKARMTALRKVITVASMTVNNCASPNKVPVPAHKAAPQKRLVPSQYKQQVSLQRSRSRVIFASLPSYPQACRSV